MRQGWIEARYIHLPRIKRGFEKLTEFKALLVEAFVNPDTTLSCLALANNPIGERGGRVLLRTMQVIEGHRELRLDECSFAGAGRKVPRGRGDFGGPGRNPAARRSPRCTPGQSRWRGSCPPSLRRPLSCCKPWPLEERRNASFERA